ncbi:MAG: AAA family ATPase [Thermodesulfobacteriota bacterium]
MRIKKLDLSAFGPFTDKLIDFEGSEPDFHLIHGPNEAGKSSALRALRQLFFGIPQQSADDFIHPYRKLRIGGTIESKDRQELSIIRRKARKASLTYADDRTPIDESVADGMLGHIEQHLFETMFAIDHEDLVRGGREIISGEGTTGEILFSAGAGLSDLRSIQLELSQKAEALFKKGGKNPVINTTLNTVSDIKKQISDEQLSENEYEETYTALKELEKQADEISSFIREKRKKLNHLQRIFNSFDAISRRREILEKLETLPRKDAEPEGAARKILEKKQTVTALFQEIGGIDRNAKEKVRLKADLEGLQTEAVEILRRLGHGIPVEKAETLRISKEREISIKKEGAELSRLMLEHRNLENEIARQRRKIGDLKEKLGKTGRIPDYKALELAVKRALDEGGIEHRYKGKLEEIQSLNQEFRETLMHLKGLGKVFEQDPEQLLKARIPPMEVIESYEKKFSDLHTMISGIREKIGSKDREIAAAEMDISIINLTGPVPTEQDLADLRKNRDHGWIIIKGLLDGRPEAPKEAEAFSALFENSTGIKDAFEHSVKKADDMSDKLRLISDQAAKKASARSHRDRLVKERESLEREKADASTRIQALTENWHKVWEEGPVRPDSPGDMRHWLIRYQKAAALLRERNKKNQQARADQEQITRLKKGISDHLANMADMETGKNPTLEALVKKGEQTVEQFRNIEKDTAFLEKEITGSSQELEKSLNRHKMLETGITKKKETWQSLVEPLGLSADASPEIAGEMVDEHRALFEKISELEKTRTRLERIDREKSEFEERVKQVTREVTGEMPKKETRTQVEILNSMLYKAEKGIEEREKLTRELEQREKEIHRQSRGRTLGEFTKEVLEHDPDSIEPEIEALENEIGRLEQEKAAVDRKTGEKKTELSRMDGSSKALDLVEHKESLLSELETYTEQYAALKIAAVLLQKAVERFREKNQEKLVTRSGEIFRTLTLKGFQSIRLDFTDSDTPAIAGVRSRTKESVFPGGMSGGTRDQLYLALRIASIEQYIESFEPLPFIVDDILVQFDDDRAKAAFQVLGELSRKTQVVFFTHNRHFARIALDNPPFCRPVIHELRPDFYC